MANTSHSKPHHPASPLTPTPADLRAIVAADGRKLYQIAAQAGVHPNYLGAMLRGRTPVVGKVADRVLAVLRPQHE